MPWGLGPDAGVLEPEEDAAGVGELDAGSLGPKVDAAGVREVECDEVDDINLEDKTSTVFF